MSKKKQKINSNNKPMNYPVGDFLIRIKNAALVGHKEVNYSASKLVDEIAKKLVELGFLDKIESTEEGMKVHLSYHKKEPVIMNIKLVSKPGLRLYKSVQELENKKGPSLLIVTTSQGILSHKEAVKKNVGGEVIAEIL